MVYLLLNIALLLSKLSDILPSCDGFTNQVILFSLLFFFRGGQDQVLIFFT